MIVRKSTAGNTGCLRPLTAASDERFTRMRMAQLSAIPVGASVPRLSVVAAGTLAVSALAVSALALSAQSPIVVLSTNPPVWGTSVRLIEELRIGVLDGDPDYEIGRIGDVAIGARGEIIVADDATPALRVYDSTGVFVRIIGGNGEGPGEYRSMGGVGTLRDGRIVLWDNRLQRLTTYSPSGARLGEVSVPSGLFAADLFRVDHEDFAYVRDMTRLPGSAAPMAGAPFGYGWLRVSPEGKVVDTIQIPDSQGADESFVLSTASGYDRPFNHEVVSTMSTRGALLVGDNRRYAFDIRRPGAPVTRIERRYTPVEVVGDERKEWLAWSSFFEERARNAPPPPKNVIVAGSGRKNFSIPRVKPPFSELTSDADGRIWVRRYVQAVFRKGTDRTVNDPRPRRDWKEPPTYDVFRLDGQLLATIVLPWDTRFAEARGAHVWLTGTAATGEHYVARYRIETSSR